MDYLIKILPNNRILVRNIATGESQILKADQVSGFFENVLESQLEAQEAEDGKVTELGGILSNLGVRK